MQNTGFNYFYYLLSSENAIFNSLLLRPIYLAWWK